MWPWPKGFSSRRASQLKTRGWSRKEHRIPRDRREDRLEQNRREHRRRLGDARRAPEGHRSGRGGPHAARDVLREHRDHLRLQGDAIADPDAPRVEHANPAEDEDEVVGRDRGQPEREVGQVCVLDPRRGFPPLVDDRQGAEAHRDGDQHGLQRAPEPRSPAHRLDCCEGHLDEAHSFTLSGGATGDVVRGW
jgi:hypothetical protein